MRDAILTDGTPMTFGDFVVLEHIADGGMSKVFAAWQPELDRVVALKVPKPDFVVNPRLLDAFLRRDVQTLASLEHPNITRVYAGGMSGTVPYLAMELLQGGDLSQAERKRFYQTPRRALELIATLANAVRYSHARGVLHCDIKPSNVLFDDQEQVRLSDFGLSQRTEAEKLHFNGGSRGWMAPEQVPFAAPRDADATSDATPRPTSATDVFALGALLFWLTKGHPPFGTGDDFAARVHRQPRPLPKPWAPALAWAIDGICYRAMQVSPEARYSSAADLEADVQRALRGLPIQGFPTPRWRQLLLWFGAHQTLSVLTVFLLLIFSLASVLVVRSGAEHERQVLASALEMQVFAARGQAAHVLHGLQETSRSLQELATHPIVRMVAETGIRTEDATGVASANRCAENPPLISGWVLPSVAQRFDTFQILNGGGCPRARLPETSDVNYQQRWYGWRDYFTGAATIAELHESSVHLGLVFRSTVNGDIRFSLSTPIYSGPLDRLAAPAWVGVASVGITVNATLTPISRGSLASNSENRVTALIGLYEDSPAENTNSVARYALLAHPALKKGDGTMLTEPYSAELLTRFGQKEPGVDEFSPSTAEPLALQDYVDPFWGGRWLAAFAPVGHTGYVVVVQTRVDAVVQPGATFSRTLLLGLAGQAALALIGIAALLWWNAVQRRRQFG